MVECLTRDRGFQTHPRHCVVSLSKNINPSLVLVQPRKTLPFITERLLMGRKESNQTTTKNDKNDTQFAARKTGAEHYILFLHVSLFCTMKSNNIHSVLCLGQDFWETQVSLYLNIEGAFTNSGGHTKSLKFLPVHFYLILSSMSIILAREGV